MQQNAPTPADASATSGNAIRCPQCGASHVVSGNATRSSLDCQRCGTTIPLASAKTTAASAAPADDLQRQLQENQSQRTEITGYINQLNIQLHRWQLRLQQLEARRQQLESQNAIKSAA